MSFPPDRSQHPIDIEDESSEDDVRHRRYGELQRAIATIVKELPKGTHLTAPEVYEKARGQGLDISLSTVYRALNKLKKDGDVITVSGDRGVRYEMAEEGEDHDHLICLGCGLTVEFSDDLIRGFGKTVAQRKGFEHKSSRFDILGYCQTCSANDQTRRVDQSTESLSIAVEELEAALPLLRQAIEHNLARKLTRGSVSIEVAIEHLKHALTECEEAALLARDSANTTTSN